jgi:flavin-dependent dehydrogenase
VSPSRFQVAVIGGGPAGLATAVALARHDVGTTVIERTNYDTIRVGEHLPPSVKPLFTSLGMSSILDNGQHLPCPGVRSAWGGNEIIERDYLFHPNGEGMNLSRPGFDRAFAAHAHAIGVVVAIGSRVVRICRPTNAWEISYLQDHQLRQIAADFIVDATGRSASIGKRMGSRLLIYDSLIGIIGQATPATEERSIWIEASEIGWWYSAALRPHKLMLVFMTDSDLFDSSILGRYAGWNKYLRSSMTCERVHRQQSHELHVRSARTQRLDVINGDAWLAVGDAAMSFDPLSSEGISKGVEWGRKAARAITATLKGDRLAARLYADETERAFATYLRQHKRYYAAEARWRGAPFWRRRHSGPMRAHRARISLP